MPQQVMSLRSSGISSSSLPSEEAIHRNIHLHLYRAERVAGQGFHWWTAHLWGYAKAHVRPTVGQA